MNWFKELFSGKKTEVKSQAQKPALKSKYEGFDIEYMPIAKDYYPRYKGKYLYWWTTKEKYELQDYPSFCKKSESKEGAMAIIDDYLEKKGVNTVIISIDEALIKQST